MDPNRIDDQIEAARELYERGEHGRAKERLYEALQQQPGHFAANLTLGKLLLSEQQGQSALLFIQKALQQNDQDADAHATLGTALYQTGNYEACIKSLRKSLELDPARHETRVQLGQVMSQFVPPWHFGMLSDLERNHAYEQLIKDFVTTDSVILDIGTGSGLLAMMAARHGAKHIYACEQSPFVAEVAREIIAQNGYSDRVTLFPNRSDLIQPHHLPEAPNLIIGEIFDSAMVGEGAVPSFRDAYKRLAAPGCRIIPNVAKVHGMLIEIPGQKSINPLSQISGFDLSAFDQFRAPTDYASVRLPNYDHRFLSNPHALLSYDFEDLHPTLGDKNPGKTAITFEANATGTAHGVAIWFDLLMEDQLILTNEPSRLDNHWGQAVCFFGEPIFVKSGDLIQATIYNTDERIWLEASPLVP